jgi:hypothetical protein
MSPDFGQRLLVIAGCALVLLKYALYNLLNSERSSRADMVGKTNTAPAATIMQSPMFYELIRPWIFNLRSQ